MIWTPSLPLFLCASILTFAADAPLIHARIHDASAPTLGEALTREGFDVLSQGATSLDLVVSDGEWRILQDMGYELELLARGQPLYDLLSARGDNYLDLAGIQAAMQATADTFPEICRLVDLTATYGTPATFEGRHLFALKISDNVAMDENEPNTLVVSCHHAREIVTPVIALHAIEQLTSLYGSNSRITELVDNNELWIAPVWNPDGYHEVFVGDNFWRKNRRVFPSGTGVDTNRNYAFGWNTGCSGSTSASSETYKGPGPASESETQTMEVFSADRRFSRIIDFHSSGRETLYGYVCPTHPQDSWQQSEAEAISQACGYGNDARHASADGEHYQWQLSQLRHAFLVETHTSFQPDYSSAQAEAAQVLPGILALAERPAPLWGTVTDGETGDPLEAALTFEEFPFSNGETLTSGGPWGRYEAFVAPGEYTVHVQVEGYPEQIVPVTVDNAATPLFITMDREGCFGDFNRDSRVNLMDLTGVVGALGSSGGLYDINRDGTVTLLDLEGLLPFWGACP